MFSYLLFDLDGTISDPKEGITGCVQYALASFGIEEPDKDKLEPFIGPPLRDSFMQFYGFSQEQADEATRKYRERFNVTGKYENTLYPGMAKLLGDLQASGAHLAIASSKPTVFVEDILRYFGIRQYFEIVVGSELDGTRDRKEDVVAEVLKQFAERGAVDPSDIVMIGDRKFDIEGAKAAGTHSIGVSYGYSAPGELEAAGAEIIVKDVEGLRRVLLGQQKGTDSQLRSDSQKRSDPYQGSDSQQKSNPQLQPPPWYGSQRPHSGLENVQHPQGAYGNQETPYQQGAYSGQGTPYQQGAYSGQGNAQYQQGIYTGSGNTLRQRRPESRGKKIAKAIGASALAMAVYYLVVSVIATVVLLAGIFWFDAGSTDDTYYFWLNLANAAGIIGGFAACFGIWHKGIHFRTERALNALSLVPMALLAAGLAMGLNGLLNMIELYKYSPTYQEVAQLQGDIPLWLGILSYGILAPLGEETVFRGIVYGQLKKICAVPLAIFLSGLAFGLFHGNLVQAVYATAIGIVLALVYEIYDNILIAMLFHGIANLFVYLLVDLTDIGGVFMIPLSCVFFLAISAVALVLMVKWQKSA